MDEDLGCLGLRKLAPCKCNANDLWVAMRNLKSTPTL